MHVMKSLKMVKRPTNGLRVRTGSCKLSGRGRVVNVHPQFFDRYEALTL